LSLTPIQKARAFVLDKYLSGLSCVWNLDYSSRAGSCHYTNPLVELLTTDPEIKGSNLCSVPEENDGEKNKQKHFWRLYLIFAIFLFPQNTYKICLATFP
jgi:hypothetical protein